VVTAFFAASTIHSQVKNTQPVEVETAPADDDDNDDKKVVVMIAPRDQEERAEPVIRAVQSQLSDLSVFFQVTWEDSLKADREERELLAAEVARTSGAAAVFWCDLDEPDRVFMYLSMDGQGRILERWLEGSGPGGIHETLGIIVRASVVAMLKSMAEPAQLHGEIEESSTIQDAGPEESTVDAGDDDTNELEEVSPHKLFNVDAAYAFNMVSDENMAVSGFNVGLGVHFGLGWRLFGGYIFFEPQEYEFVEVHLELRRHPMLLGVRYEHFFGRLVLGGILAISLDYIVEDIKVFSQAVSAERDGAELQVSAVPQIRLGVNLFYELRLFIALGIEIPFNRVEYFVGSDSGQQTVSDSWAVRPLGLLGVSMGIF
jgi:hypothetical protein